jgi:nitrogen fixation/metabolism regulation signal transduction histidine kinase
LQISLDSSCDRVNHADASEGDKQMKRKDKQMNQVIENLILNAEDGDNVGGLRYCEAAAAQRIAWENGRGVRIEVEDRSKGTYRAVVVF